MFFKNLLKKDNTFEDNSKLFPIQPEKKYSAVIEENNEEIIAAIISAITFYMQSFDCDFKIKNIKKNNSFYPWNFAGINETINSRI
ncbi:MAG: hypothetical protein LBJ09_01205 [Clostridiales bacterium]|jgi:hypothetical protein|nr:hypothetical protein [Clostridiales bacterium]